MAKARVKARKHHNCTLAGRLACCKLQHVQAAGDEVEGQDRHQHQRGTGQGVEEELHGRVDAVLAAPAPDQEVHGDQAELEEDVEEQQVQGQEDADHRALQDQHQGQIDADLVVDMLVAKGDGDGHEQGGEQHQPQADPVHAQEVLGPELGDPVGLLHKLHARLGVVPLPQEQEADQKGHHRSGQGNLFFRPVPADQQHEKRADQGQECDNG